LHIRHYHRRHYRPHHVINSIAFKFTVIIITNAINLCLSIVFVNVNISQQQ